MKETITDINAWLNKLAEAEIPEYDDLPDVHLYMDQILSYIQTVLEPFSNEESALITSFMINNYVKAKIIPAPALKRYKKDQLAQLIAICLLKQNTTMSNLAVLLDKKNFSNGYDEIYNHFIRLLSESKEKLAAEGLDDLEKVINGVRVTTPPKNKKKISTNVEKSPKGMTLNLIDLSMKLMVESLLKKLFAERILYNLGKETYNNPKLFEEELKEIKFYKKKERKESKRVKKVISKKDPLVEHNRIKNSKNDVKKK